MGFFDLWALNLAAAALLLFLIGVDSALPGTQQQSLLGIRKLLESPSALSNWTTDTNFCGIQSSQMLNISCDASLSTIIVLQIVGDKAKIPVEQKISANYTESQVRLSDDFSAQALANSLLKFPDLRVLSLVSLGIWGILPASIDRLRSLQSLNLSSNFFSGAIPDRYASLGSLQSLALDNNILTGSFPAALNVLPNLDTLIISDNRLAGNIPPQVSLFTSLKTLSLDHNMFFGEVPISISNLRSIQSISFSQNELTGNLPNMSSLQTLRYINADSNTLGPLFPILNTLIEFVILSRNRFTGEIPDYITTLSDLQVFRVSYNQLSGTPPHGIFSMPSIRSLNLDHNKFGGTLPNDLAVGGNLTLLDASSNLFTGALPHEFTSNTGNGRMIIFSGNCFSTNLQEEQPDSYCLQGQQMIPPPTRDTSATEESHSKGNKRKWKGGVVAAIASGVMALGAAATVVLLIMLRLSKQGRFKSSTHCGVSSCADTASVGAEALQNTRYLAQSGRLGNMAAPQTRLFTMNELEEATEGFNHSAVIGEGEYGRVFKGKLEDGSLIAVKSMNIDAKQDIKQLKAHLEFLSRIRQKHLVSLIGYCLEREKDGHISRRLFLVSEFINNGTLRSHLFSKMTQRICHLHLKRIFSSQRRLKESLSWPDRLAAVLGAGKGIQYLHTGVVPGIFNNDVRITNILLDQNFVAKVSDFGLGRHPDESYGSDQANLFEEKAITYIDLDHHHRKLATDKKDVYNFGLVLLEVVLGRPPTVDNPKAVRPRVQELEMMLVDSVFRTEMVDSSVAGNCSEESLSTVLEIAAKCLSDDAAARPSMEDVIWNIQYAVQAQERRVSNGDLQEDSSSHSKD